LKKSRPPSRTPSAFPPERHRIVKESDLYGARTAVRSFAAAIGFGRTIQGELTIVVSELASNILKYGVRGEIVFRRITDESNRPGIEIAASDVGPPINDFESALRDGWTDGAPIEPSKLLRRRGIGAGLGAVVRLTDRVSYERTPHGKLITARRIVRRMASLRPPRRGR
jgi:anti-sigma regulatory factor (Ser/Thr protein kinase)